MADTEGAVADEEDRDGAAGKTAEQKAKETKAFLKEERRRELPSGDWPGKGEA